MGYNTPGIIKYPFWRLTQVNSNAFYACVNQGVAVVPPQLGTQAVAIDCGITQVLHALSA